MAHVKKKEKKKKKKKRSEIMAFSGRLEGFSSRL
jgi:hypothetical protein